MIKRVGKKEALKSFIQVFSIYVFLSFILAYISFHYFNYQKNTNVLITIGIIGIWRYSWRITHFIRAIIYNFYEYPRLKKLVNSLPKNKKFPKHIYFLIPSYKEEPWITLETFKSILDNLSNIPSTATLVVSTGSDKDDYYIYKVYDNHPVKDKVELIFQRQHEGKRVAMAHALKVISRLENDKEQEFNSVTVFMDGDSYLRFDTLRKCIPFFSKFKDLGALTTNEIAYIDSKNMWYKDWFNLKFGQRNIQFLSHSLSHRVLTLTGRLSFFRTNLVIQNDFIEQIRNDTIISNIHGKFKFLMGDDKSSWYNILKKGWKMLYIPDAYCYSLESRDENFFKLSFSLPFRWYGNTMRNNERALKLKGKIPFFIWWCILDQKISMWTSLIGITAAFFLSIYQSFIYLLMYISWVLFVRTIQSGIIASMGYPVSLRTIPLMLYTQWIGSLIKIKSFYFLSDQSWGKSNNVQKTKAHIPINHWFAKYYPHFIMIFSYMLFFYFVWIFNHKVYFLDFDFFKGLF